MDPQSDAGFDPRAARLLVLVTPDQVPAAWAERAVPLMLLPLLPEEARRFLGGETVDPIGDRWDLALIRQVAARTSIEDIAKDLCVAPRTVYRRLARLRRKYGVSTTEELRTIFAATGF
jgi:CRP-like cAMP-binding protein